MGKTTFTVSDDKKTLTMERSFNAPQEKLWRAYSDKEVFEQWFAPQGWEVTSKKFDFTENGENIYVMKCVDKSQGEWYGQTSAGKMVFTKINPTTSLSYTDYFTDDQGNINTDLPASKNNIDLIVKGDSTLLHAVTYYDSEEALRTVLEMGMEQGFDQTLDKLEEIVNHL